MAPPSFDPRALFAHIAERLEAVRCDHAHRHAREWCKLNGTAWPEAEAWLRERGGYCDCEALLNAAQPTAGEA